MNIALLQRRLFRLIKSGDPVSEDDDPYLLLVQQSEHLAIMREIIFLWRTYDIERYCFFTARLLKRIGLFDETVRAFIQQVSISPFIEKLGETFLEDMSHHTDPRICSMAQFERALFKVKQGDRTQYIVEWEYDPYLLLQGVMGNAPLDEACVSGSYRTIISGDTPGLFRVVSSA